MVQTREVKANGNSDLAVIVYVKKMKGENGEKCWSWQKKILKKQYPNTYPPPLASTSFVTRDSPKPQSLGTPLAPRVGGPPGGGGEGIPRESFERGGKGGRGVRPPSPLVILNMGKIPLTTENMVKNQRSK